MAGKKTIDVEQATLRPEIEVTEVLVAEQELTVGEVEEEAVQTRKFDPLSKLIKVKGNQLYLQVRDRLVWLREEHPEAQITTHLVEYYPEKEMWVVHAEVRIWVDAGGTHQEAIGSGIAQETERDFPAGALEKAETKAIGRAVASLGYGTQFALELDEGTRYADTPVEAKSNLRVVSSNGKNQEGDALREEVIKLLSGDKEAAAKLPKGVGELTEDELQKTKTWLQTRLAKRSSKT